jgi:RNA polymerase sigma factor (sigma-70 family)
MINGLESLSSLTGHPEPLIALHARMVAPLRSFFRSYRLNAADIDDLTQEVFARLAGRGRQTNLRKPEAFVFTLARNLVRDRARRLYTKASSQSIPAEDARLSCGRPTPERRLELEQDLEGVERLLSAIKPTAREAFVLHRVHGENYATIAAHMNISVSMVEKHIMSAMQALRVADTQ